MEPTGFLVRLKTDNRCAAPPPCYVIQFRTKLRVLIYIHTYKTDDDVPKAKELVHGSVQISRQGLLHFVLAKATD